MYVGIRNALIRQPGDSRALENIYQDYFDRIVMAEQAGYDFIWFGEHHFFANQWNPSPLIAWRRWPGAPPACDSAPACC
jgi:alkanesulfonate monooxygenase SsuD/methylene tetrahydromethanopterin reductase-like flavin-dependent oxidoreductase (luciferase family)